MKLCLACILDYSQYFEMLQKPYLVPKRDRHLRFCHMYDNAKLCIVMKMVRVFVKK